MRKIRSFILLSTMTLLLLIGGCASAPDGGVDERVSAPESAHSIDSSEPRKRADEDSATGNESQGVAPSADMLHRKSEKQSDDMERLD